MKMTFYVSHKMPNSNSNIIEKIKVKIEFENKFFEFELSNGDGSPLSTVWEKVPIVSVKPHLPELSRR